ncbi:hypothetical protein ACIRU3_44025 [Streptomyces sp. NPDC101151]|uniref:hypothetical protein n=1 Tax=Streptomyces sp. NPDC101151 TaxID=3366115 RepID=UPI00380E67D6
MRHLAPVPLRRGWLAALSVLSANVLVSLVGTSAHAAGIDNTCAGAASPNTYSCSKMAPVPDRVGDCNNPLVGFGVMITYPWPTQGSLVQQMPISCKFTARSTPSIVPGTPLKVSATLNVCNNSSEGDISLLNSITLTHTVTDMYGTQVSVKAGLKLGEVVEIGVEAAFQYQHTIAQSVAQTTTKAYGLHVPAHEAGYVQFTPQYAVTNGELYAYYPYNVSGQKTWSVNATSRSPLVIPGTTEPDGQYSIAKVPC